METNKVVQAERYCSMVPAPTGSGMCSDLHYRYSQMPQHLISDAHEWINEIPAVPIFYRAEPLQRERACKNQRILILEQYVCVE
jgi:hypothetical protein